jgi:hypothetical protein
MKSVLLSTGAALFIGLATITSATSAEKSGGGGGGGAGFSRGGGGGGGGPFPGGGGGGGASFSRSAGSTGGSAGGFSMSHEGPSSAAVRGGNAGAFNGGNSMSFRGDARMGRMDHDRGHDHDRDGRFRGPRFAFGFNPGYDYYANDYDDGCYRLREERTRYGWRWRRIWVCD